MMNRGSVRPVRARFFAAEIRKNWENKWGESRRQIDKWNSIGFLILDNLRKYHIYQIGTAKCNE